MLIDNIEMLSDQVAELVSEARTKDEKIAELKEELGAFRGKEEVNVKLAYLFQDMKHTLN